MPPSCSSLFYGNCLWSLSSLRVRLSVVEGTASPRLAARQLSRWTVAGTKLTCNKEMHFMRWHHVIWHGVNVVWLKIGEKIVLGLFVHFGCVYCMCIIWQQSLFGSEQYTVNVYCTVCVWCSSPFLYRTVVVATPLVEDYQFHKIAQNSLVLYATLLPSLQQL